MTHRGRLRAGKGSERCTHIKLRIRPELLYFLQEAQLFECLRASASHRISLVLAATIVVVLAVSDFRFLWKLAKACRGLQAGYRVFPLLTSHEVADLTLRARTSE